MDRTGAHLPRESVRACTIATCIDCKADILSVSGEGEGPSRCSLALGDTGWKTSQTPHPAGEPSPQSSMVQGGQPPSAGKKRMSRGASLDVQVQGQTRARSPIRVSTDLDDT